MQIKQANELRETSRMLNTLSCEWRREEPKIEMI